MTNSCDLEFLKKSWPLYNSNSKICEGLLPFYKIGNNIQKLLKNFTILELLNLHCSVLKKTSGKFCHSRIRKEFAHFRIPEHIFSTLGPLKNLAIFQTNVPILDFEERTPHHQIPILISMKVTSLYPKKCIAVLEFKTNVPILDLVP